jgi:hypothetical protein
MTDLGAARAHRHDGAPPQAHPPAVRPTAYGAGSSIAETASRAAAREAALAALSAARSPRQPLAAPVPAPVPPAGPARDPVPPRVNRDRGGARGIGVTQLICWQLALVSIVLAGTRPWPVLAAVVAGAAVVVAATAVRLRGRRLSSWLVVGVEYLLRDRVRDLRDASEAGRALLRLLSPDATGSGGDTGFRLSRAAGITVVLQPKPDGRDLTKAMPAPEALLPPPHEPAEAVAAQVIHHAGNSRPPRVWLALQALRTPDVHHDADVRRALGNTVRRVRRRLRRDGLPAHGLTEAELLGTLASLAHVTAGRGVVREEWRHWHSGPITQATFRLGGWADLPGAVAPQMLRWLLAAVPHAAVTIAVTAHRPAGTAATRTEATVRVAAAGVPVLEQAVAELTRLTGEWGLVVERLDGRHARGMAATLPIGLTDAFS